MRKKTETYRVGNNKKYEGSIKHHTEKSDIGSDESDEHIQRGNDEWDLIKILPRLENEYFRPYLKRLNLPDVYQYQIDGVYFPVRVLQLAEERGIEGKELQIVRQAVNGFMSLTRAKYHVAKENYKDAALYIARAMPEAVLLMKLDMEHQWHIGKRSLDTAPGNASNPRVARGSLEDWIEETIEEAAKKEKRSSAQALWDRLPTDHIESPDLYLDGGELVYKDDKGIEKTTKIDNFKKIVSAVKKASK